MRRARLPRTPAVTQEAGESIPDETSPRGKLPGIPTDVISVCNASSNPLTLSPTDRGDRGALERGAERDVAGGARDDQLLSSGLDGAGGTVDDDHRGLRRV